MIVQLFWINGMMMRINFLGLIEKIVNVMGILFQITFTLALC